MITIPQNYLIINYLIKNYLIFNLPSLEEEM